MQKRSSRSQVAVTQHSTESLPTLDVTAVLADPIRGLDQHDHLMARDARDAAVVLEHEMSPFCSFDLDLDGIPGVKRLEPPAQL